VSRTTLSPDSADGLADHSCSGGFRKIGLGSSTLDEGVELLIGESRQCAVDRLEAGAGAEEDGQDFLRERLPIAVRQRLDLFGEGPDLRSSHTALYHAHRGPCRRSSSGGRSGHCGRWLRDATLTVFRGFDGISWDIVAGLCCRSA
jgi:hypothetical protein